MAVGRLASVEPRLRLATAADVDALAMLSQRDAPRAERSRRARAVTAHLDCTQRRMWVATVEDQVVGFGRAMYMGRADVPAALRPPVGWYLMGVSVAASFRRHGIGHALTQERLAWLAQRTEAVHAITHRDNEAARVLLLSSSFCESAHRIAWPRAGLGAEVARLWRREALDDYIV